MGVSRAGSGGGAIEIRKFLRVQGAWKTTGVSIAISATNTSVTKEPLGPGRGHTSIALMKGVAMPNEKPTPIKPVPFPGESPTVALAMAAGQKYGLHEEPEKPAKARPKRRAATKKKAAAKKPAKGAGKPKSRAKRAAPRSRAR